MEARCGSSAIPESSSRDHGRAASVFSPVAVQVSDVDVGRVHSEGRSSEADSGVKLSLGFILNDAPPPPLPRGACDEGRALVTDFANMVVSAPSTEGRACRPSVQRDFQQIGLSPRDSKTRPSAKHGKSRASTAKAAVAAGAAVSESSRKAKAPAKQRAPAKAKKAKPMTYEERRLARKCTVEGCFNYTINKGLCFRHGGGKQCTIDGCDASAKVAGLCWKHGGSVQCNVKGCDRRGKSRGLCWAHGGGTKCQAEACEKVAVSNGFCWAHGGGKRCLYEGCQRPAYERTFNYCPKHYKRYEDGDEAMEV